MNTLKAYAWQLATVGLAVLVAVLFVRGVSLDKQLSDVKVTLANERTSFARERDTASRTALALSETYRKKEKDLSNDFEQRTKLDKARIAELETAAAKSDAIQRGLRTDLATFVAAHRSATLNGSAVGNGPAGAAALDLLADLYTGAESAESTLARALDRSYAAGLSCEARFDRAREMTLQ